MLILTRKAGEALFIGEDIQITIEEIKGDKAKISINAPKDISILRKELLDAQNANKEALETPKNLQSTIKYFLQHNDI